MSGFVYLLVCAAALAVHSQAQVPPGQPGPGQPGIPNVPRGGQPGVGAGQPGMGQPGLGNPGNQPNVTSSIQCPELWMKHKGSCYRLQSGLTAIGANFFANQNDGKTQGAANAHCAGLQTGATLVTVNSREENNFLFRWVAEMMGTNINPVWIGLHVGPSGQWQWYSGEPVTYTNWEEIAMAPDPSHGAMMFDVQPNNNFGNPFEVTSQWASEDAFNDRHFICEYVPRALNGPVTTARPALLNSNGGNFRYLPRRRVFGGWQLLEVPRRSAAIRMNPYFNVLP